MKLSRIFLAIGIAIIFAVFVGYAMYVLYEPPKYYLDQNNTCYQAFNCENMTYDCYFNKTLSAAQIAEFGYVYSGGPEPVSVPDKTNLAFNETCYNNVINSASYMKCLDDRDNCNKDFQKSTRRYFHARNSFYILLVISIITLVVGAFFVTVEGVSSGLIGGGILVILFNLIYTNEYWLTLGKYVKLIALFLVLVLLFYIGYTKFKK